MSYEQFTQEERYQIYALMQAGYDQTEIAEDLGRSKSTICRELKRNTGKSCYRPRQAHMKAMERRRSKVRPRFSSILCPFIEDLLRKDWSPEQISGRLKHEHGRAISHETIYQYVYADKKAGGDLHTHLRCQKKRRKRYGSRQNRRGIIPNRTSIDEHPSVMDSRELIGDWEGDTIIGRRHKGALVSMVVRSSLFTLIEPVNSREAYSCPRPSEAWPNGIPLSCLTLN